MKRLILAVLLILALPATAQEAPQVAVMPQPDGSMLIHVPPETVHYCQSRGGCRMVTAADLEAFAAHVKKSCGPGI